MENFKNLRTIIILLGAIMAFEIALLLVMSWPAPTLMLITLLTLAIAAAYLISLSWGLLKELNKKGNNKGNK